MSAKGPQWAMQDLRVGEVRERDDFQVRARKRDRVHVRKLSRALEDGKVLPRIDVAVIGNAMYVIDGFHRLQAHRLAGRATIPARTARMSLGSAKALAGAANRTHGKGLDLASRNKLWDELIAAGGHYSSPGCLKTPRALETELDGVLSRETIRKRLLALGLADEMEPVKSWAGDDSDAAAERLAQERVEDAEGCLYALGELAVTLEPQARRDLVAAARALLDAIEAGEGVEALREAAGADADMLGI